MSTYHDDTFTRLRSRARRAEQRAVHLEAELERAIRIIGTLAEIAAGSDCDPLELLAVAEQIDDREQAATHWTPERVTALLRSTSTDSPPSMRAAA